MSSNWFDRIIGFVAIIIGGGGCLAFLTQPATTPIWFIIGILWLLRIIPREMWSGCTMIIFVQWIFIMLFGLAAWIDLPPQAPNSIISPQNYQKTLTVFGIGLIGSTAIFVAWRLRDIAEASASTRWLIFFLHLTVIVGAVFLTLLQGR